MTIARCVITTIQKPTPAVQMLQARLAADEISLIVAGDKKGPPHYELPNTQFLSLEAQLRSGFRLAGLLPAGHYTRKNIGYLTALADHPEAIYETDDDNAPSDRWSVKQASVEARPMRHAGWVNVYRCFSGENIWPRGLPLRYAQDRAEYALDGAKALNSPIQQLLCDHAPDVDAAWRLTVAGEPFQFDSSRRDSIYLPPGAWCPFNSQATWWFRQAFPLMYLPSTCTFRMTDIWRSLIAQRCLWELDMGVTFHPPEVVQERNPHDLMKDFADEIPGYLKNEEIARVLGSLKLSGERDKMLENLLTCYEALVQDGVFESRELELVRAWLEDFSAL